jgi:prolyl oligopeptidase
MLGNKIKTYQDLDSVAQALVALKWTKPSLIASRGTSNGGLTVSATALLYPADFGLSIPISGVDDLLGKDILDAENQGWSGEYGSVASYKSNLKALSPVENASHQGALKFLIVDGADDTRVNPAHSVKLAKALEDLGGNPDNVLLLTVADAGHWTESYSYQNAIGLQTEVDVWTAIFDMAGWRVP